MTVEEYNVQVFNDTRQKSLTKYQLQTQTLISNTVVHESPIDLPLEGRAVGNQLVTFVEQGTLEAAAQFTSGRTGVLNFADARVPGGNVLNGETTQEECLCRSSNLYESLLKPECEEGYYQFNRGCGPVFSDRLIYSPGVLVFKDDIKYNELQHPFYVDVVTCPAPFERVSRDIPLRRIKGIINAFRHYNVDNVVLGAWGCGAFGQDALMIGGCFCEELFGHNYFKNVVFAIRADVHSTNFDRFCLGYNSSLGF